MTTIKEEQLIGIPTIEGLEIFLVDEIIRCEGLQKCTRIVTTSKKDIISAYSIGQFKKLLGQYSVFFSTHRSHLINLAYASKFRKSGEVILRNGDRIPITKERKEVFLRLITCM